MPPSVNRHFLPSTCLHLLTSVSVLDYAVRPYQAQASTVEQLDGASYAEEPVRQLTANTTFVSSSLCLLTQCG